jgi:purine catabolism regulator
VRDELLRTWPTGWVLAEVRRVIALLPLSATVTDGHVEEEHQHENNIYTRLERLLDRVSPDTGKMNGVVSPEYSCGCGRIAQDLQGIPFSFREAQQALEIGRRLFGEGKLHSFARLGIYRLLFYLDGNSELNHFYQEMARTMHFHRNSLLYRLNRIEALLGRSLEDPELRLSLQIALKIHHLRKR